MTTKELIETQLKALTIYDANNTCLTVDECAKFLKVHIKTVTNRIQSGKIKAHFIGRIWRIPKMQFLDVILKTQKDKNLSQEEEESFEDKMDSYFQNKFLKSSIK